MEILKLFESIRTGALDQIFLGLTLLGQQELLIAMFCVLYWLVDKRLAYRIGVSAFTAIGLNQFLKITFAVPRPFVRWPQLKPVAAALPAATGFSFPSGHTANAVAAYGMAGSRVQGWKRAAIWFLPLPVAVSRLYLGVHTLSDVLVSLMIGIPLVLIVSVMFDAYESGKITIHTTLATGMAGSLLLAMAGLTAPGSLDPKDALDCFKAAGGIAGFTGGFFIEHRWIHHDPKGSPILQIQKLVAGFAGAILLMVTAKAPMNQFFGVIAGSVLRYGLVSLWIVAGLPAVARLLRPRRIC